MVLELFGSIKTFFPVIIIVLIIIYVWLWLNNMDAAKKVTFAVFTVSIALGKVLVKILVAIVSGIARLLRRIF